MFMRSRVARNLCVAAVLLVTAAPPVMGAPMAGFDINGYIVGSWRNVDNGHVYVIAKSGSAYEFRAGDAWKTGEGCDVSAGDLLYTLNPKQDVGGYLNGGDYVGPWRLLRKDAKGACNWTTISPGQAGFYEGISGFVPTSAPKTTENPAGQAMNWFCAYTGPYTQCAALTRVGPGFVQSSTQPTPTPAPKPSPTPSSGATPAVDIPWPTLPDAQVPLDSVSNGCGGGDASTDPKLGDTSTYYEGGQEINVDFRDACKIHDAGYSGAKVADPFRGGDVVDYFDATRLAVDTTFLTDMRLICEEQVPAWATTAMEECKGTGATLSTGAMTRYNFVRRFGWKFFKERPELRGLWDVRYRNAPQWAIVQDGRTVRASWRGGRNHRTLRGEFRGTIISRDNDCAIQGFVRFTEKGKAPITNVPMTMTWNPARPDQIKVPAPAGPFTLGRD